MTASLSAWRCLSWLKSRSCDRDGLPSLQVAGQQGAYVARMINRGYVPGRGGLMAPFPCRREDTSASSQDQVPSLLSAALTSCYVMSNLVTALI